MKIRLEIRVLPRLVATIKSAFQYPLLANDSMTRSLTSNTELMKRVVDAREYRNPYVEIPFEVDPTYSVDSVRQIIKDMYPWLKEYDDADLLIVNACDYKPLMDDNSTLEECMVKDGGKILISHWDEFPLPVYLPNGNRWLVVNVSPFHTFRKFKDRLYEVRREYPPEKQILVYKKVFLRSKDDATLLSLGIGSPTQPLARLTVLHKDYSGPLPCSSRWREMLPSN